MINLLKSNIFLAFSGISLCVIGIFIIPAPIMSLNEYAEYVQSDKMGQLLTSLFLVIQGAFKLIAATFGGMLMGTLFWRKMNLSKKK